MGFSLKGTENRPASCGWRWKSPALSLKISCQATFTGHLPQETAPGHDMRRVELPGEIEEAILECDTDSLAALLEQHPEWRRATFHFHVSHLDGFLSASHQAVDPGTVGGKDFQGGLAAAALRLKPDDAMELLEVLVEESGVALDVETSFHAGSSRASVSMFSKRTSERGLLWSGPVIHDAICTGRMETVRPARTALNLPQDL